MNDPDFAACDHPGYPDRGWDESVRRFDEYIDLDEYDADTMVDLDGGMVMPLRELLEGD